MTSDAGIRPLAWHFTVLTGVTWVLLGFGAAVRAHGAGLACPDWPLCFGEVIPPIDFHVALEFGHRVVAGIVSLGLLGGLVALYRNPAARGTVGWLPWVAVGLLGTQIVLGGLTVLHLLAPWTVGWHLLVGNAFAATLLLIAARLWASQRREVLAPTTLATQVGWGLTAALLVLQLRLGGLVSSNHAGLACTEWPTCTGGAWVPTMEGLVGIHLLHRFTAYALAAAFLVLALRGGTLARWGFALVVAQVGLGVANVLLGLPAEITIAHTYAAAGLVLITTHQTWDALRRPVATSVAEETEEVTI